MARSMMKAKRMPAEFRGEAVSTAVFILNRSPTKALEGWTSYKAWNRRKPNVTFLRMFGCVGHVTNAKPFLSKLEDRSTPMVFLGCENGSKVPLPHGLRRWRIDRHRVRRDWQAAR